MIVPIERHLKTDIVPKPIDNEVFIKTFRLLFSNLIACPPCFPEGLKQAILTNIENSEYTKPLQRVVIPDDVVE